MAQVNADPESLRQVRASIDRFQKDLDRSIAQVRGSLRGAKWNDERRRDFERDLEKLLNSIAAFSKNADQLKAHLARKADDLDRFLAR